MFKQSMFSLLTVLIAKVVVCTGRPNLRQELWPELSVFSDAGSIFNEKFSRVAPDNYTIICQLTCKIEADFNITYIMYIQ